MSQGPKDNRRVLVVDDNDSIHADYRKILCPVADDAALDEAEAVLFGKKAVALPRLVCELDSAFQGLDGVAKVAEAVKSGRPYAVAFVDMRMPPGIDGLETIEGIWKADPQVQVVICSAYSDYTPEQIVARLHGDHGTGALNDRLLFLRKPFDSAEVSLITCSLISKWNAARRAALRMSELESLASERTSKLSREVAERRAAEDQMRHMAMHDSLTGLHNREYLMDRLRIAIDRLKRDARPFAVLFLDLDNFKLINDSLGHDAGDALLVSTANRLTHAVRDLDCVSPGRRDVETTARLGGDEFVVLLDGIERTADAAQVADRIQAAVSEPFVCAGRSVVVSVSIGVTVVDKPSARPEDILRDADTAMYRAKGTGKARYAVFDEQLHDEAMRRLALETDLRLAFDEGQFELAYEPIVEVESARVCGFEALLRWNHPVRGVIPPSEFIPVAEETGLIVPLGRWVIRAACKQLAAWTLACPGNDDLSVSVNISKRQLVEPGLVDEVSAAMTEFGVTSPHLVLEITESSIMEDLTRLGEVLRRFKALGVPLHLDDFGTGLSSLASLHQLPIDTLKIDRSFIMNMTGSIQFAALVHAVLTLAKNLRIKVIAEGVESNEQLAQLIDLECDYLQGFHLSKTLTAAEAGALIGQHVRWRAAA
jgi:diguanylate cyclase